MDCFHDHYDVLEIEPRPRQQGLTPIQRCMVLARVSHEALLKGFNQVKSKLEASEASQSAEALQRLSDAWDVLGDPAQRTQYNLIVLNQAMQDHL